MNEDERRKKLIKLMKIRNEISINLSRLEDELSDENNLKEIKEAIFHNLIIDIDQEVE
jgi:hypothetical protein